MAHRSVRRKNRQPGNEGRYVIFPENISSLFLFLYCLCLAFTILLADFLLVKTVQFVLFFIIVFLTKKRRQLPGMVFIFLSTLLFNLLAAEGKVLFHVLGQPITAGAVQRGVSRGLTLVTLYYMSKSFIGPGMRFQGRLGTFLAKIFSYFDFFTNEIRNIRFTNLWGDIDRLLLRAERLVRGPGTRALPASFSTRSFFLFGGVLAGNIILLILNYAAIMVANR